MLDQPREPLLRSSPSEFERRGRVEHRSGSVRDHVPEETRTRRRRSELTPLDERRLLNRRALGEIVEDLSEDRRSRETERTRLARIVRSENDIPFGPIGDGELQIWTETVSPSETETLDRVRLAELGRETNFSRPVTYTADGRRRETVLANVIVDQSPKRGV